jgi:DNA polymerase-3 subunit gamma/tau
MTEQEGFQALYNKYRPQQFAEVVGQKHIVRILQNSLAHNRVSHAYLFSGERGTGKTTVARILAKAINCLEGVQPEPCNRCENCLQVGSESFLDLIEIDAASNTSVDDIRDLREKVRFRPSTGRYKVYIIDEVHQLSRSAYNAFLKTLEEPPDHAIFILATTDPHRVLPTIRSRCQHLRFRRHTHSDTVEALGRIAEGEDVMVAGEALHLIARNADGSLRDAIGLLDQAISFYEGTLTEQAVQDMLGLTGTEASAALTGAIAEARAGDVMRLVNQAVQDGGSPASIQQELVNYFRGLLLAKTGRRDQNEMYFAEAEIDIMESLAEKFGVGQIVRCLELLGESGSFGRAGQSAQLELELALVNACLMMTGAEEGDRSTEAHAGGGVAATPAPAQAADGKQKVSETPETPATGGQVTAREELNQAATEAQATTAPEDGSAAVDQSPAPAGVAAELDAKRDEFRQELRAWSRAYEPYVMNSRWYDRDGALVLTAAHSAHYDILSRPESRETLRRIVTKLLGRQVKIEIEPGESVKQPSVGKSRHDTLIDSAVNLYGAEILDDQ